MNNISLIMARLAHRYPCLLVDRVLESSDMSVRALKNVTINEPFFQGHFPGNPVMPGVLVLDALAQASAFLDMPDTDPGEDMYLMAIDNAKLRKPVVPGDQLILEVNVLFKNSRMIKFIGQAIVDGVVVTEAVLSIMKASSHG